MSTPQRRIQPHEADILRAEARRLYRLTQRGPAYAAHFGPQRDQIYADLIGAGYPEESAP